MELLKPWNEKLFPGTDFEDGVLNVNEPDDGGKERGEFAEGDDLHKQQDRTEDQ
jgi:hypothetical protein